LLRHLVLRSTRIFFVCLCPSTTNLSCWNETAESPFSVKRDAEALGRSASSPESFLNPDQEIYGYSHMTRTGSQSYPSRQFAEGQVLTKRAYPIKPEAA